MCRLFLTAAAILVLAISEAAWAQTVSGSIGGGVWKGMNELQPLMVQRSSLGAGVSNCPVTDRAGVKKDLEDAATEADLVEQALGLTVLFLTGDEGGKAEQEMIPALLSKAKTGAKVVAYWNKAQEWWYDRSDATRFRVCRPGPGVVVVRPLKLAPGDFTAPHPLASALAAPLWKQPLPVLTAPLSRPVQMGLGSTYFRIPVCMPITGMWLALSKRPSVTGRAARLISLRGGMEPVSGAVVTLLGPSPASCQTGQNGTFAFDGLIPGNYTLMVGLSTTRTLTITPGADLQLGDLLP